MVVCQGYGFTTLLLTIVFLVYKCFSQKQNTFVDGKTFVLPPHLTFSENLALLVGLFRLKWLFPIVGLSSERYSYEKFRLNLFMKYDGINRQMSPFGTTTSLGASRYNKMMLGTKSKAFLGGAAWPFTFTKLLGNSLFTMDGDEHKATRRVMLPPFHASSIDRYAEEMHNIINGRFERSFISNLKTDSKVTISFLEFFKSLTFDIALKLLIGAKVNNQENDYYAKTFETLASGLFCVPVPISCFGYKSTWSRAIEARDILQDFVGKVIQDKKTMKKGDSNNLDENITKKSYENSLSLLLDTLVDGKKLTDHELLVETILLCFAGHETTASLLSSAFTCLCENPGILKSLRVEQEALLNDLGFHSDDNESHRNFDFLTYKMIESHMPYLLCFYKECERRYPPVAQAFRITKEEIILPDNFFLAKNSFCGYDVLGTNHDPAVFDSPLIFDPLRWDDDDDTAAQSAKINTESMEKIRVKKVSEMLQNSTMSSVQLLTFGSGPRGCIGMPFAKLEFLLVLTKMTRLYDFSLQPNQDLSLSYVPSTHVTSGGIVDVCHYPM